MISSETMDLLMTVEFHVKFHNRHSEPHGLMKLQLQMMTEQKVQDMEMTVT